MRSHQPTFEEAREWAAHWAKHWFVGPDGHDRLTLENGISAGWATHVEAYGLLLDFALDELGIPRGRSSLHGRLRARGWDRAIRAAGLRLAKSSSASTLDQGVVFVIEIPTPSATEPIRRVAAAIPPQRRALLSADPRVIRTLRRDGLSAMPLTLSFRDQQRCLRLDGQRALEALDHVQGAPPTMLLRGHNVAPDAIRQIHRWLRRSLPWLTVESRALFESVDRLRPGTLVVASDQHRIGRLSAHVAGELGISLTVLQHGLPQSELGFLPVIADRIAAWSPDSVAWFAERGTNMARLEILGNPRMDSLSATREQKIAASAGTRPRLLLALSPAAVSTNQRVLSTSLEVLALMREAELVVKLHPGYREWSWVAPVIASKSYKDRVRVAHHEDIGDLLRWADVTLVHRSTVGLDSLAAGTPVVAVLSDAPSVAEVELSHVGLPRADEPSALAAAVAPFLESSGREAWFQVHDASISQASGPLDGRSANRIATMLLQDAALASDAGRDARRTRPHD